MSLLNQNITRKEWVDENVGQIDFDANNNGNKKYKVEAIYNSVVYTKKLEGYLPGLYYLIFWKKYSEKENIWKPTLAVQHFRKLIRLFYKDHPNKPPATPLAINTVSPIARPTI